MSHQKIRTVLEKRHCPTRNLKILRFSSAPAMCRPRLTSPSRALGAAGRRDAGAEHVRGGNRPWEFQLSHRSMARWWRPHRAQRSRHQGTWVGYKWSHRSTGHHPFIKRGVLHCITTLSLSKTMIRNWTSADNLEAQWGPPQLCLLVCVYTSNHASVHHRAILCWPRHLNPDIHHISNHVSTINSRLPYGFPFS